MRALTLVEDLGIAMFPTSMKVSHAPHLDILGAPIGDYLHCTNFISVKRNDVVKLSKIAAIDPQVAFIIFHMCGAFCKEYASKPNV